MTPWGTDILIDMKESIFNRFISLRALHKSSAITVDAEHMKDKLINFGIEPSKIQIIFFGTNTKEYVRIKKERSRIREKYNILETDIVVISTRTLNPIHDVFLTIQSIPLVLNENKNVKFIIASDGSERTQMKEYVANLGISDYVIFPGYMTSPEMVAFLSASDIYVSSSKADAGLSASTAEAMSTGLPVIVSDNSDNRFWVKDSGILFEDGDSQGIADGILSLVDNSGLMETLGSNGKSRILIDNDYETEMNKVNTLYLVEVNKN
jgi:glycosyltransferase involved in cell wall biosynthesis